MNGAEETKSYILKNLSDRVMSLEKEGSTQAKINAEKIAAVMCTLDKVDTSMNHLGEKFDLMKEAVDKKWFIIVIAIIVIAVMAGINIGEIAKGWVHKGMLIP